MFKGLSWYKVVTFWSKRNTDLILKRSLNLSQNRKFWHYLHRLISKSNIKFIVPFYNWFLHLLLSFIIGEFFFALKILGKTNWLNMAIGLLGALIPTVVLNLIGTSMEIKIKKQSIAFLTGLKNFNITFNDVFKSFEQLINSSPEPLKSYLKSMIYKYKAKSSVNSCIDDFRANVGYNNSLGVFMNNLKIALEEGADINKLIDEYVADLETLNKIDDEFKANEIVAKISALALILIFIFALHMIYTTPIGANYVNALWHQTAVAIGVIVCLVIVIRTLRKV